MANQDLFWPTGINRTFFFVVLPCWFEFLERENRNRLLARRNIGVNGELQSGPVFGV